MERGFELDLQDVRSTIETGMIEPRRALELFERIEPELHRYPAIDPTAAR